MSNEENLHDILQKVQTVDNDINSLLVPILKDTIKDSNSHNRRLFILSIIMLVIMLIIIIFSLILVFKQNLMYQDFLNQLDFESNDSFVQDLDTGEGGDIINSSITKN